MNREIKFRAWNTMVNRMRYFTLQDIEKLPGEIQWHILKIMQYTGLKDNNGKEIYEGDILENDNGVKYVVVWMEQLGGFYLQQPNTQRGKEIISCAASKVANETMLLFKEAVIGNIYENPELLQQ